MSAQEPTERRLQLTVSRILRVLYDYVVIFVGVVITAVSLDGFLIPNKIAAGGVSGLATIIYHVFGVPVGVTIFVVNAPLLLMGVLLIGAELGVKTVFGSVMLSVIVEVLRPFIPAVTSDLILAAVYGGVLAGLGMGLTFRYGGTTGGTDLGARILNHFTHISVGRSLLIIDFAVVAVAGVVFDMELALYALVAIFITSKLTDLVQEGFAYAKTALIISSRSDEIADAIMHRLERGVTALKAVGRYSGAEREVLICVVSSTQITPLKNIVKEFDANAFVTITDTYEVLGEGFKPIFRAGGS